MAAKKHIPWYKKEISLGSVKIVDVVTLTKDLSVMLEAGLTVPEAVDVLEEQATGKLKKVLRQVSVDVEGGEAFGDAVAAHPKVFNEIFISSIRIGEKTGTLSENLQHLSEQMERDLEIRRSIQGAMMYPAVIVAATLILGLALATFVLPQMAGIFDSLKVELPFTTRVVMWLADVFQNHGSWLSPLIVLATVGFAALIRQPFAKPVIDRLLLKIPGIRGFVHDINRAHFCRSLGTMLETGVPIQEALQIATRTIPNVVFRNSVVVMHKKIESGEGFADIMDTYPALYPKMIQRMVAVGERSGSMGNSLLYLARFYEEKVGVQAKSLSTIIEPLLLIFIGLGVGFVAMSIFTPIYSVTEGLTL